MFEIYSIGSIYPVTKLTKVMRQLRKQQSKSNALSPTCHTSEEDDLNKKEDQHVDEIV